LIVESEDSEAAEGGEKTGANNLATTSSDQDKIKVLTETNERLKTKIIEMIKVMDKMQQSRQVTPNGDNFRAEYEKLKR